jgi:polysaccharide deacetylase 2 family uncharacterized protein YibQ
MRVVRKFLLGLTWGAIASMAGLTLISQIAPPPIGPSQSVNLGESGENPPVLTAKTPTAPLTVAPATQNAPTTTVALPEVSAAQSPAANITLAPSQDAISATPAEVPAPSADATGVSDSTAPMVIAQAPAPQAPTPQGAGDPALPVVAGSDENSGTPATPPKPMAVTSKPEALPQISDAPKSPELSDTNPPATAPQTAIDANKPLSPTPDPVTPEPDAAPKPKVMDTKTEVTLLPDTGLGGQVDGVITGRMASIQPTPPIPSPGAEEGVILPETTGVEDAPWIKYASTFTAQAGKPKFAILLVDDGAADIDRKALAELPFMVSFVVDPLSATAAEATAIYRAAGREVLFLASGIPVGANASDLAQTFQAHSAALPETVAVIDLATGGFQDDRALATQVVPIVKDQGRGLVTFDRGLNTADQVARREGVPTATVYRVLDGQGEDTPLIRRYLDRAAFKAAQDGQVIVLGQASQETIKALLEWTVEGRASSVDLAPLTAMLRSNP